ncbi:hypothetical protein HanRHA438_Chr17g0790731 [Helianthus annuus]|nr:hypothetical protein HanRHA438_Chr17g0790731 [Helianthus annuus]
MLLCCYFFIGLYFVLKALYLIWVFSLGFFVGSFIWKLGAVYDVILVDCL